MGNETSSPRGSGSRSRSKSRNGDPGVFSSLDNICSTVSTFATDAILSNNSTSPGGSKNKNNYGGYSDDEESNGSEEYGSKKTRNSNRGYKMDEKLSDDYSDDETFQTEEGMSIVTDADLDKKNRASNVKESKTSPIVTQKPLASSFAKRCHFTKAGIGKTTQHYEGLTLSGNLVLMLANAMNLKGCPTICDEDLRRVEKTYPNQFGRLPDELLLSSGWRRISKYCHFSMKSVPDGMPFFHSKEKCHPNGGYYFLLAAAVGMVRPMDVEPLTRDNLVVLETDFPTQCDVAPQELIHEPSLWVLVDKFCFFSGGPINVEEDVYYEANFEGNMIYMLAFLSPSLTPEELYRLGDVNAEADDGSDMIYKNTSAVMDVETVYDLTDRDFDDLKLYHLGPCRAIAQYLMQPNAWTKVLPVHFVKSRELALQRAQAYEAEFGVQQSAPQTQVQEVNSPVQQNDVMNINSFNPQNAFANANETQQVTNDAFNHQNSFSAAEFMPPTTQPSQQLDAPLDMSHSNHWGRDHNPQPTLYDPTNGSTLGGLGSTAGGVGYNTVSPTQLVAEYNPHAHQGYNTNMMGGAVGMHTLSPTYANQDTPQTNPHAMQNGMPIYPTTPMQQQPDVVQRPHDETMFEDPNNSNNNNSNENNTPTSAGDNKESKFGFYDPEANVGDAPPAAIESLEQPGQIPMGPNSVPVSVEQMPEEQTAAEPPQFMDPMNLPLPHGVNRDSSGGSDLGASRLTREVQEEGAFLSSRDIDLPLDEAIATMSQVGSTTVGSTTVGSTTMSQVLNTAMTHIQSTKTSRAQSTTEGSTTLSQVGSTVPALNTTDASAVQPTNTQFEHDQWTKTNKTDDPYKYLDEDDSDTEEQEIWHNDPAPQENPLSSFNQSKNGKDNGARHSRTPSNSSEEGAWNAPDEENVSFHEESSRLSRFPVFKSEKDAWSVHGKENGKRDSRKNTVKKEQHKASRISKFPGFDPEEEDDCSSADERHLDPPALSINASRNSHHKRDKDTDYYGSHLTSASRISSPGRSMSSQSSPQLYKRKTKGAFPRNNITTNGDNYSNHVANGENDNDSVNSREENKNRISKEDYFNSILGDPSTSYESASRDSEGDIPHDEMDNYHEEYNDFHRARSQDAWNDEGDPYSNHGNEGRHDDDQEDYVNHNEDHSHRTNHRHEGASYATTERNHLLMNNEAGNSPTFSDGDSPTSENDRETPQYLAPLNPDNTRDDLSTFTAQTTPSEAGGKSVNSEYTPAMRGAHMLLKRNRERRAQRLAANKLNSSPITSSESSTPTTQCTSPDNHSAFGFDDGDRSEASYTLRVETKHSSNPLTEENDQEGSPVSWASADDNTSVASGSVSSSWTDASKSSRRALILKMAQKRMKGGNSTNGASSVCDTKEDHNATQSEVSLSDDEEEFAVLRRTEEVHDEMDFADDLD